jgi:hypothetical protein
MKKAEVIIYSLLGVGFVLKLFKLPFHTVFILAILFVMLSYYLITFFRKKRDAISCFTGVVTFMWSFCLLARLKHFPFLNILFILSLAATGILIWVLLKRKHPFPYNVRACATTLLITIVFICLPTHRVYYITNIMLNTDIESDYFSWDKYSWFLYNAGMEKEAELANENARVAVESCLKEGADGDEAEYAGLIEKHKIEIIDKCWTKYR